jgi:putative transposase
MGWGVDREQIKRWFIEDRLAGGQSMTELCAQYGISRQAGYALMRRYEVEGLACLQPRSRAPHRVPWATPAAIRDAVVACRLQHPSWGPKKLKACLERQDPETAWPAASTMGDLLTHEGLVRRRRRPRRPLARTQPFAPVSRANDLWGIDFKGWFRTKDGQRCDPLTVTDAHSRALLGCRICPPTAAGVEPAMDRVLQEHGLPDRLRLDNGPPWGSRGVGGLTRLSVKWLKLGIGLEFIPPGCPQANGRHERMHATLKAETLHPPAATPAAQQQRFDAFRRAFNGERPHEALGQATPASVYERSWRGYPARLPPVTYPEGATVRRVRSNGEIKWQGELVFVGEALVGEPVLLEELESGDTLVRFLTVDLAVIDRRSGLARRCAPPRPKPQTSKETPQHQPGEVSTILPV